MKTKIPFVECEVKLTPEDTYSGLRKVVRTIFPEYTHLPDELFAFKKFTDGLSNVLFRVDMNGHKVLVRVYGVGTEKMLDRDAEIRQQIQLSRRGLTAKFFAKFRNGCCYEYLEGTPLDATNVGLHVKAIGHELGKWHRVTDIHDESETSESSAIVLVRKWLKLLPHTLPVWKRSHYNSLGICQEFESLLPRLIESPLRFCHNDVLPFNILLDHEGKAKFIDYEYAGWCARGFDLGNHFNEFTGFDLDFSRYPDTATQIHFIEEYLCSFYECEKSALSAKEIEHVHREANQWSLVSHFLWSVWALFQASYSTIDFDFVAFSNRRFEFYFRNRDKFLSPKTKDFVYE